jgi:Uri superfamily endonuclease
MDERLHVNSETTHVSLAVRCLALMNKHLKKHICEIGKPSWLNSEIPNLATRLDRHVSEELRNACHVHWMAHLTQIKAVLDAEKLERELGDFSNFHLLHGIEVLSLS